MLDHGGDAAVLERLGVVIAHLPDAIKTSVRDSERGDAGVDLQEGILAEALLHTTKPELAS